VHCELGTVASADSQLGLCVEEVDVVFKLPGTGGFIGRRDDAVPLVLFALGSMPRGAFSLARVLPELRNIDSLLFSCEADRQIFHRLFEKGMMNSLVIPFGVDCERFNPLRPSEQRQARERFGIPQKGPLLLYAGRINVQKNIHTLLKMFQEVSRYDRPCRLYLVGDEDDTDFPEFNVTNRGYQAYLRSLAAKYNIGDRVIVLSGRWKDEDLRSLYSAADVFVNCTIHHDENFGFSQVEAMACGTPVVCSKWGGLKDTVIHGKTGFHTETILTNNGIKVDWRSGVDAVLSLLRNPGLRTEMSKACVEHVRKNLSLDRFALNLEKAIRETVELSRETTFVRRADSFRVHPWALKLWRRIHRIRNNPQKVPASLYAGKVYEIYRFLIEPYCSTNADNVIFCEDSVPYFLTEVELDGERKTLKVADPVWPKNYPLERWKYEILSQIDGRKTINSIYAAVNPARNQIPAKRIEALLKRFCHEGVIHFYFTSKRHTD